MVECMRTAARDSKTERIKVSCLDIIVTMIGKKPYYEIKYKEIGEDYYHVGYSSYKLENVLAWKDECFEIVKECRPQTNADRIRNMTDEELAKWFDAVTKDILGGSTWDKKDGLNGFGQKARNSMEQYSFDSLGQMVPCPDREKCGAYKCPPLPDGTPR